MLNPSAPNFMDAPGARGLDAAKAAALRALSDDRIDAAVLECADDDFWKQDDAVRRRTLKHFIRSTQSPTCSWRTDP